MTMPDHLDQLSARMHASEWRPRPRTVPRLRQVLAERLTDPDWLSSPILKDSPMIRRPALQHRDLREADLYLIDAGVAQMAATLAHAQRHLPGAELEEQVRTLRPDTPPARYGFMVFGLPVAWPDELFEIVAVSWAPSGNAPSGGVEIIAWAALSTGAASAALSHAGMADTPRTRQQLRITSGPLLPISSMQLTYARPPTPAARSGSAPRKPPGPRCAPATSRSRPGAPPGCSGAVPTPPTRLCRRCGACAGAEAHPDRDPGQVRAGLRRHRSP
jgi:hypothetical protein